MGRVLAALSAFLSSALLWAGTAAAEQAQPVAMIADPNSLESVIHFRAPDEGILKRGDFWWRADVYLPRNTSLQGVEVMGYDPVFLRLKDGRCFKVNLDGDIKKLTKAAVVQTDCPPTRKDESAWPAPLPRKGMRYVGRAWDLDAWADQSTGKTILIEAKHQDGPPLLTTDMRVVGLGGLGAPDAPMTEVTLVGYIKRQLTIATVMLYYAG